MKTKIIEKKDHTLTLEVEVEPEILKEELGELFKRHLKELAVPGFRKGHVPPAMAKKLLTEEALLPHALEHVVPYALEDALKKEKITPLTTPSLDIKEFDLGNPVVFQASFEVKPEIEISDYKGMKAQIKKTEIKASDLDEIMNQLREMAFRKVPVTEDRALQAGDFAIIDFSSTRKGKAVPQGSAQDFEVEMQDDKFIPGFMENLMGMKKGESREFSVVFPQDYPTKLRGQSVDFSVTVKEIKQKELPELSDDFAKEVSTFATLAEYREDLKKKLEEREQVQLDQQVENQVVQQLLAKAAELPQSYLAYQREYLFRDLVKQLNWRGDSLENYLHTHNLSMENLGGILTAQAELMGKEELILDAVAKAEKLEVTPEEIEAEILAFAQRTNQDVIKVKEAMEKEGTVDYFVYSLLKKKVRKFLREAAVVEYEKAEAAPKTEKAKPAKEKVADNA